MGLFSNSLWHHAKFATGRRIIIWGLKENGRNVWLKVQYLTHLVSYRKSASFVYTMFTEIKRNIVLSFNKTWFIYLNEAVFRYATKWQNTVPWVTPVSHFDLEPKLFSVDPSQILRDARNGLLNTHKIFINYHVIIYTLEAGENFRRSFKIENFRWIPLCIFNFAHCKFYFSSLTLHAWGALKSQYLFVVGASPFPVNQNVNIEYSRCALQIFCR